MCYCTLIFNMITNSEPVLKHYSRILAVYKLYALDFNDQFNEEIDLSDFPSSTEIESLIDTAELEEIKEEANEGDKDAKSLFIKISENKKLIEENRLELDYLAKFIVQGTLDNKEEIDSIISMFSINRPLNKINIIDRNILRISVFSLLYLKDIHQNITIDEAVKISRNLSTNVTYKFINGILDSIAKSLNAKDN